MGSDPYLLPHMRRSGSSGNLQMSAAGSGLASSSIISYWQLCTVTKKTGKLTKLPLTSGAGTHGGGEQPATGGVGHVRGDLTCTRLLLVYQGLINGGTMKGCFYDLVKVPQKHWKWQCTLKQMWLDSVFRWLQVDKALKGRRETWQPAVQMKHGPARVQMIQLLDVNLLWPSSLYRTKIYW